MMSDKKFVLIDGNSLVNRAFYALPPLSASDGTPTQAVYGFATMLIKAITDIKPDFIAVAFDLPEPTFRHIKYKEYKAQRKGMPDELALQLPVLRQMLDIMGIKMLSKPGFEADDIIGTMAKRAKCKTYIITGDRDSFQLIDENVSVMLTRKGLTEIQLLTPETLKAEYSITPAQVVDYKALCGDASDNIPGVAGIGEKTAVTLINEYGSLDNIYANLDKIAGKLNEKLMLGRDSAYLSQCLATIDTQMDLPCEINDCGYAYPFSHKVKTFFIDKAFKSLVKRDDLFNLGGGVVEPVIQSANSKPECKTIYINSMEELKSSLKAGAKRIALNIGADKINFAYGYAEEYEVNVAYSLIDGGLDYTAVANAFAPVLNDGSVQKILFDYKYTANLPQIRKYKINNYLDVKILQYLIDMSAIYDDISAYLEASGVNKTEIAGGLMYVSDNLLLELEKLNMHNLYYGIELPLSDILCRMERDGFKIDAEKLTQLGREFSQKQAMLTEEIYAAARQEFNINSPKQLLKVLFEDMAIPYPVRGKNKSTSADILEQISDPIAKKILSYRFYAKLNSTYVEGLKKVADENGIIHTEFKQTLTTTGRLSSVEPNLQNIPVRQDEGRLLRAAFVAREGNVLVSADYSQIELRLMAHLSGDGKMISAYLSGEDIHTSTAAEVFGVEKDKVTSAMRRDAKAVNFGIIYGISDYGLANNLGIAPYKAKEYIARYFERFSGVKAYLDKSVKEAKSKGYAVSIFNRIRKIPELFSQNYNLRQFGERAAMNMPLQASSADIIKAAMVEVDKALIGMKSKLILQVHDELIIDADINELEAVKEILREKMENAARLSVPLKVEIGVGKNWFDCK